ncbi:unnamed protein product [Camellia sinensis]|uniref:Uncharacterized protein n=2 Tax=Camellia sinensis TaxID=4442 RepID=A0A4S4DLB7_CAMSN|nr:uncharacterized protein LOC114292247 [Camellia sinensis]THG03740.1 hypothetical protein TEA_005171 [Camellia sinensis var. sinensis]
MASTSSISLPSYPLLNRHRHHQPKRVSKTTTTMVVHASIRNEDQNYRSGRIVDENLIVLRKRIHEMKMIERNYDPPANWMDWEKNCYAGYDEFICEAMGVLQSGLMNTRPSLALGMAVIVGLSVPASTGLVVFHLVEMMINGVLSGVHHLNY